MTDRNLFLRAAEGDPEAEREVLARLRRKHSNWLLALGARDAAQALYEFGRAASNAVKPIPPWRDRDPP